VGGMIFFLLISFIVLQRIVELVIAKRNERQLKNGGAIEFGTEHYPWIVLLHTGFFMSLIMEVVFLERPLSALWYIWLTLFALAQWGRVWVIRSLGKHWNTKIIVLPNAEVIAKGPYKYVRHPNYVIVATEIMVLSLLFNAFFTAILFSLLNAWMMKVRIPVEEQALKEHTEYAFTFQKK
jgi:methyltransferase